LRVADRPISIVEAVTAASILVSTVALLSRFDIATLSAFIVTNALPLSLALGFLLLVAPVALYFVLSDE
jgi:hypothetical protein